MKNFFDQYFVSKKKKLRNFFYWKKFRFIFLECSKRCPKKSSKGTKNNQEKILSSFRDIPEKEVFSQLFFSRKPKVAKFFYWKNFRFIFFRIFQKMSLNLYLGDQKQWEKNIEQFSRNLENSCKHFRKKGGCRFWRHFLKKRTFRFFSENIPKDVEKHY